MLIQFMTLPALISLYDHVKAQGSSSVHKSTVYFCICVCVRCVCVCLHMTLFACQGDLAGILAIFVEDADWEN